MNRTCRVAFIAVLLISLVGVSFGCAASNPPAPPPATKAPAPEPTKEAAPAATKAAAPTAAASPTSAPAAKAGNPVVKPLDPPVTVKASIAARESSAMAALFVAQYAGFFKDEGIVIDEVPARSTTDMMPGLATGELDVLTGSVNAALFNVLARGIDLRIVGAQSSSSIGKGFSSQGLLIRKDLVDSGKVKKTADLKGLKIATSGPGQLTEIGLSRILAEGGLTLKDVDRVIIQNSEMTIALKNKSVDAAVQSEPARFVTIDQGSAVLWKELKDVLDQNHTMTLWMYSPKFASQNSEVAKRFMVAVLRGAREYADAYWYNKPNRPGLTKFLSGHMKVTPEVVERSTPGALAVDGELNMKSVEGDQEFHYQLGLVKEKTNVAKYVDLTFLDYALGRIGRYKP